MAREISWRNQLAEQGRAPLRGGHYAVERILDARRTSGRQRGVQVLIRWRGGHDDEWRPLAACNALTKREAQVLVKRKFPPKRSECWEERSARHKGQGSSTVWRPLGKPGGGGPAESAARGCSAEVRYPGGFPGLLSRAGASAGALWRGGGAECARAAHHCGNESPSVEDLA